MQGALQIGLVCIDLFLARNVRSSPLDLPVDVVQTSELGDVLQYQVELYASPIILHIPHPLHKLLRQSRLVLKKLIEGHMVSRIRYDDRSCINLPVALSHSSDQTALSDQFCHIAVHLDVDPSLSCQLSQIITH